MKLIKINYLTYYFIILFFMCGLIKTAIIVFIIVLFHEFGHVCAAKLNSYKIISVTIYPFGGLTKLEKDINSPFLKDLFLAINGVVFQIILFMFFKYLNDISFISNKTFSIFYQYNNMIMFFNLLPIEPLDGSQILEVILSKFFPYKKTLNLKLIISFVCIIIFFFFNYTYCINNYFIIVFLIIKLIEYRKNINYLYNKFLLERYLNSYKFSKIRNEKNIDLKKIRKNIYYYFWKNNAWVNEKDAIYNNITYKED